MKWPGTWRLTPGARVSAVSPAHPPQGTVETHPHPRFLEEETLQVMPGERELLFWEHLLCFQTLCCVLHGLSFWIFTKIPREANSHYIDEETEARRLCNLGYITNK